MCKLNLSTRAGVKFGVLTAASIAFALPALAQAADEPAAKPSRLIEEIVVTAQKREQKLEEVPLAIQAFSGDALAESGMRDFAEVITVVPGASEELGYSIGVRRYQIRGIAQGVGDSTVGYYFGDAAFAYYGNFGAPQSRAFDMNRVEVLRGPQSTLYGNGAMGGVVRFVPNAADPTATDFIARTGLSDTDGGDAGHYVDAAANFPLLENELALRVSGGYETVGGYQDFAGGQQDAVGGYIRDYRAIVGWEPTETVSASLMVMHNASDQNGAALLFSLEPPTPIGSEADNVFSEFDLITGTLEVDLGFAALNTTSTVIDSGLVLSNVVPFPGAPNDRIENDSIFQGDAFNHETRLVSQSDGPFQWITGIYYSDTESVVGSLSNAPNIIPPTNQVLESKALSVFAEGSWELLEGRLIPLVGLRWFDDDRATNTEVYDSGGNTISSSGDEGNFNSVNPRLNLTYMPSDDAMVYFNVAKGFRSGNFNNPAVCAGARDQGLPCQDTIDSDELWSYELGHKRSFLGEQVVADVALYYQDWQDIRQGVPFAGLFQDSVVGQAELIGIDVGLQVAPAQVQGLLLNLSGNWNQSEFTELDPAVAQAAGAKEGDRLAFVPEWTLSLTADYQREIAPGWMGQLNAVYSHLEPQNGQFGSQDNAEGETRDLLRTRIGVKRGDYGIHLFGKNLLGEDGAIYVQRPTGGLPAYSQDYPRQIGLEFSYDLS